MRGLLLGALLAAGCVTETTVEDPAGRAAKEGGWATKGGEGADEPGRHPAMFDPPERPPEQMVHVPAAAYAPVDQFFDNEGFLVADRIVIDCSFEPFRTRLVALSYEGRGDWVIREEGRDGDVVWVKLRNGTPGAAYQSNIVPTATFGSHREPPMVVDPRTGRVVGASPRSIFEFVGTEEILVRFHLTSPRDRPVWFEAKATGTATDPALFRDTVYMNANRRRHVKGPDLSLLLDVRRAADGAWGARIVDPGSPEGADR